VQFHGMRIPIVLAANLETLIGVAFLVISLISWMTNYLNARAKPNAPNRGGRPVRPRSERIQSEIEQFMREQVRQKDGDAPPAARPQPEPQRPVPQKMLPQRRPAQSRGPAPRPAARKPAEPLQRQPINQSSQSSAMVRPGDDITHRKSVATEGLGQALRDHLKSAMVERVQSESQSHLGSGVSAEVTRHLGTFGVTTPAPGVQAARAPEPSLIADLQSRDGMRRALIAQMILERPTARRRGRIAGA